MYHCYNEAHKYLYNKYGGPKYLVSDVSKKLTYTTKEQRKEIMDSVIEKDYQHIINDNNVRKSGNDLDIHILTLMGQYNYGITVRKELHNLLKANSIL